MSGKREKFERFVDGLSPVVVREQLVLAYLQMERCQQVLRGEAVCNVDMMDNGENTDLELFYLCRKVREELDYLDGELGRFESGKRKGVSYG